MCACLVPCAGMGNSFNASEGLLWNSRHAITQLAGDPVHPLPLQVQAASTQLSWVVGSTMLGKASPRL